MINCKYFRLLLLDSKLPCPLHQWLIREVKYYVDLEPEKTITFSSEMGTSILPLRPLGTTWVSHWLV
uniref:Uncharacterized protein n=1 Tax=Lynx canadensis TaxID=61383 RepID=A0A667G2Z0_LYNCA